MLHFIGMCCVPGFFSCKHVLCQLAILLKLSFVIIHQEKTGACQFCGNYPRKLELRIDSRVPSDEEH